MQFNEILNVELKIPERINYINTSSDDNIIIFRSRHKTYFYDYKSEQLVSIEKSFSYLGCDTITPIVNGNLYFYTREDEREPNTNNAIVIIDKNALFNNSNNYYREILLEYKPSEIQVSKQHIFVKLCDYLNKIYVYDIFTYELVDIIEGKIKFTNDPYILISIEKSNSIPFVYTYSLISYPTKHVIEKYENYPPDYIYFKDDGEKIVWMSTHVCFTKYTPMYVIDQDNKYYIEVFWDSDFTVIETYGNKKELLVHEQNSEHKLVYHKKNMSDDTIYFFARNYMYLYENNVLQKFVYL